MAKRLLVKFTLLAAFEADQEYECRFDDMGDRLAEQLRSEDGTLTVGSEYDYAEIDVPEDADGTDDNLAMALGQRFPSDGLTVGPVPGVRVLGRNGTFKKARLERKGDQIHLYLGTEKEQLPLVTFPASHE